MKLAQEINEDKSNLAQLRIPKQNEEHTSSGLDNQTLKEKKTVFDQHEENGVKVEIKYEPEDDYGIDDRSSCDKMSRSSLTQNSKENVTTNIKLEDANSTFKEEPMSPIEKETTVFDSSNLILECNEIKEEADSDKVEKDDNDDDDELLKSFNENSRKRHHGNSYEILARSVLDMKRKKYCHDTFLAYSDSDLHTRQNNDSRMLPSSNDLILTDHCYSKIQSSSHSSMSADISKVYVFNPEGFSSKITHMKRNNKNSQGQGQFENAMQGALKEKKEKLALSKKACGNQDITFDITPDQATFLSLCLNNLPNYEVKEYNEYVKNTPKNDIEISKPSQNEENRKGSEMENQRKTLLNQVIIQRKPIYNSKKYTKQQGKRHRQTF